MKEFILKSSDFQIRETKKGEDFVALVWPLANSKELMEELKACGVEKYEERAVEEKKEVVTEEENMD